MKKNFKLLCAAVLLGCFMAVPAQAAETKVEYKEAAAPIRSELKETEDSLRTLRTDNKASAAAYKAARLSKKETGSIPVNKASWKKARELHRQIISIRRDMGKTSVKELRQNAQAAARQKDFNSALHNLEQVLDIKEKRLENMERIHELWQEIDALLTQ